MTQHIRYMKFLLFFIIGFTVFYMIRQRLRNRQRPEKPLIRTVKEVGADTPSIPMQEKNKQ